MHNYCTLFNSTYLTRGLAMYNSLDKYVKEFHLYIFAFDEACFLILKNLNLSKATIIPLIQFEDKDLLAVKSTRTAAEYCWTCTPSIIRYAINTYGLQSCTYLDADLLFFGNPQVLFEEMGDNSVLITPHHYTEKYDQSATSGTYCVQFVCFKNTKEGMEVLEWWRNACLDWCYARVEDGKFGDQKYLDDWTKRFNCVHACEHRGAGIAPWNIQQYEFGDKDSSIWAKSIGTRLSFPVIFYHYHGLKIAEVNSFIPLPTAYYDLNENGLLFMYKPYMSALVEVSNGLKKRGITAVLHENIKIPKIRTSIRRIANLFFKGKTGEFYHINYFKMRWLTKLI